MVDVLREVAAAVREQAGSCIAPVQAAFLGLADRLEAKAAELPVSGSNVEVSRTASGGIANYWQSQKEQQLVDADNTTIAVSEELEIKD